MKFSRKLVYPVIASMAFCGVYFAQNRLPDFEGGAVQGSGTINTIPLWSTPTVLGDSIITESSGAISIAGSLGVGIAVPVGPFEVLSNPGAIAIHVEENSGGEDWRMGVDSTGDLNFFDEMVNRLTFQDNTGNVGIADSNPQSLLDVGLGSGVVAWFNSASEEGILIDPDVDSTRVAMVGDIRVELIFYDTGGSVDEKTSRVVSSDGSTRIEILNDAFDTISHVSLDMSHATGLMSLPSNIGGTPPAACVAGAVFIDTDETDDTNCTTTADNSLCLCVATDTWVSLT